MKIIEILKLLSDPKFQRIVVVGTSCSGKTTFASKLAQALGFTYIELDAIYWKPNWSPRPLEEFRALVEQAIAGESWVVGGNYRKVRDLIWKRATHIIWLNLPFLSRARPRPSPDGEPHRFSRGAFFRKS